MIDRWFYDLYITSQERTKQCKNSLLCQISKPEPIVLQYTTRDDVIAFVLKLGRRAVLVMQKY